MKEKFEEFIPHHESGMQTNTESSKEFDEETRAKEFYKVVRDRLFHINEWHDLAGAATAAFTLTDDSGRPINRTPRKDDFIRIDIPGPGTVSGEGDDWVQIEMIEEAEESDQQIAVIQVRPAPSPVNERKDVAHFFSNEATSSFIARREKTKVIAGVYGRNEKPNTETETVVDKIRNAAVASGAISGFSKIQWKSLVNGLVKES